MLDSGDRYSKLRQRAEALLDDRANFACLSKEEDDVRTLVHDLSVYQIELELQNEELQRAQYESERVKDSYAQLYHRAPVGYLTLDENGIIIKHNLTFAEISGLHDGKVTGSPLADLFVPEDRSLFLARFRPLFRNPEGKCLELRLERFGRAPVWVRLTARGAGNDIIMASGTEPGKPYLLVIVDDIDHRKRTEEEVQRKNAEIEQFIYTVSHDLRSPLVTIATFLGYLEHDLVKGDGKRLAQDIEFIHGAANKMKTLLDELLEMSRIGRIENAPVRVALSKIITDALDSLAGMISTRNAIIRLPEEDVMLHGDRNRLCQIWQNLIENAIKYSSDATVPCIDIGWRRDNDEVVFYVKDNGIGIAPDYHAKIFNIFEKLDPQSPGAGLGLSMVQRIVELRNGRIWVESEGTGAGSCFCFTLPPAEPA